MKKNVNPDTSLGRIAIVGGGAAGMACALSLARAGKRVALLERGERLGRKLSATGNGQGNVSNLGVSPERYRTDDPQKLADILRRFDAPRIVSFLESMGGIFLPDGRGRIYPTGRQASAVTDLFRGELSRLGVEMVTGARVREISRGSHAFGLAWEDGQMCADAVVLAAGGKAAPSFGTDGSAYALAQSFGHSCTPLSPALVPLKCDPALVRGWKGIRVDGALRVQRGGATLFAGRGDILFAEGGVSGDLVFRASSYAKAGDVLLIDFLPDVPEEKLLSVLGRSGSLLCVLPNGIGRMLGREKDPVRLARTVKEFRLPVTGDFGFSRAQVTQGGIPLAETDGALQSILCGGLFFAGEILNVDGDCGGYNLHWAFASALCVAEALGGVV